MNPLGNGGKNGNDVDYSRRHAPSLSDEDMFQIFRRLFPYHTDERIREMIGQEQASQAEEPNAPDDHEFMKSPEKWNALRAKEKSIGDKTK